MMPRTATAACDLPTYPSIRISHPPCSKKLLPPGNPLLHEYSNSSVNRANRYLASARSHLPLEAPRGERSLGLQRQVRIKISVNAQHAQVRLGVGGEAPQSRAV